MSEARVDRLAEDMRDIRAILQRLEPMLAGINAELPHLATKAELTIGLADLRAEIGGLRNEMHAEIGSLRAELAAKPSHAYLWGVMGAMVGAQAVALAAAALIFTFIQARPPAASKAPPVHAEFSLAAEVAPYSCRLLYAEQKKCAFGSCDPRTIERLKRECLRDGGRP